jgi:hypothetical protein
MYRFINNAGTNVCPNCFQNFHDIQCEGGEANIKIATAEKADPTTVCGLENSQIV